eukprot:3937386-Rhodomonas_salina.1
MCAFVSAVPAGHHGQLLVPCLLILHRYAFLGIDVGHQLHPGTFFSCRPRLEQLGFGQEMPAMPFCCQELPCNSISDCRGVPPSSIQ